MLHELAKVAAPKRWKDVVNEIDDCFSDERIVFERRWSHELHLMPRQAPGHDWDCSGNGDTIPTHDCSGERCAHPTGTLDPLSEV